MQASQTRTICTHCNSLNRISLARAADKKALCGKCGSELPVKGAISELSASSLDALLSKTQSPVVVDFWAPWCGPCKAFAPVFETAASQLAEEILFVKINTQEQPFAANTYKIRGIPTLLVLKQGVELDRISGSLPLADFLNWLKNATAYREAS